MSFGGGTPGRAAVMPPRPAILARKVRGQAYFTTSVYEPLEPWPPLTWT
jgi:hypothetical protein